MKTERLANGQERRIARRKVYHPRPARRMAHEICKKSRRNSYLRADDLFDDLPRTSAGPEPAVPPAGRIRVEYRDLQTLPEDALCVISDGQADSAAPLTIDLRLERLRGPAAEVWYATGPTRAGREGLVRYAHDDQLLVAVIEEDERAYGGIRSTAEKLYASMRQFQERCGFPQLLRMWNYFDAINEGEATRNAIGSSVSAARSASARWEAALPAATAIGRQRTTAQLQVFWVAARSNGIAIENPRR